MLNNLKQSIRKSQDSEFITEAALKHTDDDDIKDAFLEVDDSEDDPEINKLIDDIPEYGDDADIDADLQKLEESFIPETKI